MAAPSGDRHPMGFLINQPRNPPFTKPAAFKPSTARVVLRPSLRIRAASSISAIATVRNFSDRGQHMLLGPFPLQETPHVDVSTREEKHLEEIATLVSVSGKPVLYVGGGYLDSSEWRRFVELTEIPVAGTIMVLGAFRGSDDLVVMGFDANGNYLMNVQELATVREENVPVAVMVLDNERMMMVFQPLVVAQVVMNDDLRAAIQKMLDTPGAYLVLPTEE